MKNLPPTLTMPSRWQLLQWIVDPLKLLDNSAARYGDCFTADLGRRIQLHFFSHPQAIEQIFTANPQQFDVGRSNKMLWILWATLGDYSLLLLDGQPHRRQRQLLMPPFHGERMRTYGDLICQTTERAIEMWKPGIPFNIRPVVQQISLQIILKAVFGLADDERYHTMQHHMTTAIQLTANRFGFAMSFVPLLQQDLGRWSPGGRFWQMRRKTDQLIYDEIQTRREHPDLERTDVLSLLLAARDEQGQPMTDMELRDELVTLLVAGHETTATALSWALYWIHYLPDVKEKLMAELATIVRPFNPMAIARLPYLNAVCSEVLRIYPVAFLAQLRITRVPMTIAGYELEAGSYLAPCIYLSHRRPDLYPDPNRFNPDRFLERQFSAYEYFPFGGSDRRCIGAAFALFEMKLVLATILTQHHLQLMNPVAIAPIRRGVTIAPRGAIHFVTQ